jgi:hypothetical protein
MSLKSIITGAATGFLAGGPAGAVAGGVAGGLGGGGVQGAADATKAALDAQTLQAFQNQLEHAKKEVAIQRVNQGLQEVQKAAQA